MTCSVGVWPLFSDFLFFLLAHADLVTTSCPSGGIKGRNRNKVGFQGQTAAESCNTTSDGFPI